MPYEDQLDPNTEQALRRQADDRGISVAAPMPEKLPESQERDAEPEEFDTGAYIGRLAARFRSHIPDEEWARIPPYFANDFRQYRNKGWSLTDCASLVICAKR
ncbi:MAG TPA: hypothetical protein VKT77_16945 [Chthonomonadaceae bacterium]|nr:hypothetical protein [Chthonomonadaceae bacterium]